MSENFVRKDFVYLDGYKVIYRWTGEINSPNLLLVLHGWNTTGSGSWEQFLNDFAQNEQSRGWQIIAPDMPGFGESTPPKSVWGAQEYADFVMSFIRAVEHKITSPTHAKTVILGHSFGGAVAMLCATSQRHIFSGLVLVAPAIVRKSKVSLKNRIILQISRVGKLLFQVPYINRIYMSARKLWYKLIGSPDYARTAGVMSEIMRKVVREDLQDYLKLVSLPTLILWGSEDTYTPAKQAHQIISHLKNAQLVVYQKQKHGLHLTVPNLLVKDVALFINSN